MAMRDQKDPSRLYLLVLLRARRRLALGNMMSGGRRV
jgi:hypothetical protein